MTRRTSFGPGDEGTVDVVREIERVLNARAQVLPLGAAEWLNRHRRSTERLRHDAHSLRKDQYVEWEFAVRTSVWSSDEDYAASSPRRICQA